MHSWRSENCWESVSFHPTDPWDQTQVFLNIAAGVFTHWPQYIYLNLVIVNLVVNLTGSLKIQVSGHVMLWGYLDQLTELERLTVNVGGTIP